jgi:uncharacterized membrane protein YkvA (DUF1232 family)
VIDATPPEKMKIRATGLVRVLGRWKQRARKLKREVYALYFACRDPRVPWYAKALAVVLVGYAFSPVDLIPDFIPVLGYLDELILIPLGVIAIRAMVPTVVMDECRERATQIEGMPTNWIAAAVIMAFWLAITVTAILWLVSLKQ